VVEEEITLRRARAGGFVGKTHTLAATSHPSTVATLPNRAMGEAITRPKSVTTSGMKQRVEQTAGA
jgi:hypothetical protein